MILIFLSVLLNILDGWSIEGSELVHMTAENLNSKVCKSVTRIDSLQIMWGSSPAGPGARATQFLDDYYSGSQQNTAHGQQRF